MDKSNIGMIIICSTILLLINLGSGFPWHYIFSAIVISSIIAMGVMEGAYKD